MTSEDIIRLYKKGHSVEYIIDKYYMYKKKENKIINLQTKRIILIEDRLKKRDISVEVYKIIYDNLNKNRTI